MQLNINLLELPAGKAQSILLALAGCFGATEVKTGDSKPPKVEPKVETFGNKLAREQEDRVAAAVKSQDRPPLAQQASLTDAPPLTIVSERSTPAPSQNNLSAGPPSYQGEDDMGNDQAATAPANTTNNTTTTTTVSPVELDADTPPMPWDERIHAGTKTKMNSGKRNGCWKYKPKISPDYIAEIEAELRSGQPAPQQAAPVHQAKPETAVPSNTPPLGEAVQHIFDSKGDFPVMLKMVTGDVSSHKVPQSATSCITGDMGFTNIMQLGNHPDRYQEFADTWVALRGMIALDPNVAQQCLTDWPGVSAMLKMAF